MNTYTFIGLLLLAMFAVILYMWCEVLFGPLGGIRREPMTLANALAASAKNEATCVPGNGPSLHVYRLWNNQYHLVQRRYRAPTWDVWGDYASIRVALEQAGFTHSKGWYPA